MDELEEIKKRKLIELQKQQEEQIKKSIEEQKQIQQQIEQLEMLVKQFFTKEALERYGNLKSAHPEKAIKLLMIVGEAIQQGRVRKKISDSELKEILKKMEVPKRNFKIIRK